MAARMGSTIGKRMAKAETRRTGTAAAQSPIGLKRLVWRISPSAPQGEWVDPSAVPASASVSVEPAEVTTGGFLSSSFDLLRGTDVKELEGDTVPSDLYDEFFPDLAAKQR